MITTKSPAFQFYPKDALADTAHLSPEAFTAYFRLQWYAWVGIEDYGQGTLPKDDAALAALAGMGPEAWDRVRDRVLNLFDEHPDCYEHKRLRREAQKQVAYSRSQARKGRIGNERRWGKRQARRALRSDRSGDDSAIAGQSPDDRSSSSSSNQDLRTLVEPGLDAPALELAIERRGEHPFENVVAGCNAITGRRLSLTPERARKIRARLKEGFTADQLFDAMRGAHADPYYRGEDPKTNGRRYDQPETVFRDAGCVERHIEYWQRVNAPRIDPERERIVRRMAERSEPPTPPATAEEIRGVVSAMEGRMRGER